MLEKFTNEFGALKSAMEDYDNDPEHDISYLSFCIVEDTYASEIEPGATHVVYVTAHYTNKDETFTNLWDVFKIGS